MSNNVVVGIVDWGIGGTALLARLRTLRPDLNIIYVSDSGHTPFGKLPALALRERLQALLKWLATQGVTHTVLACNAASTALPRMRVPSDMHVEGVIRPTVDQLIALAPPSVVVLGGIRTIESSAYERPLQAAGVAYHGIIAQPLSALVEAGTVVGDRVDDAISALRRQVPHADVHTLVPACTHYLALRSQLVSAFRPQQLIDPAEQTLHQLLTNLPAPRGTAGALRCVTTGDKEAMRMAAQRAFAIQLPVVATLNLP